MNNGRIKIISDLKPTGNVDEDKIIIPKIINSTLSLHKKNQIDIKRLFNYYYNVTDIIAKTKKQQPEINNKIGIDYASIALNTINGYCFANNLTYSSRKINNEEEMKAFNDSLDDDNYNSKLKKLTFNYGICGLAYKYIIPANDEDLKNKIWYKTITDIDPYNTYCVYDNSLENNIICAISICKRKKYNENYTNSKEEIVYTVWTKWHQWEFVKNTNNSTGFENNKFLYDNKLLEAFPLVYEQIPIIEYRSLDGTGYFELAIDLINAINALASSRVDDVQQSVDYIITLRDIDTDSDGALDRIKDCLKEGLLSFRSIQGAIVQPSIDVLDTKLNQSEIETLQKFLCDKVEEVLCIPNRNTKSSGGDTGSAVESRNGFRSLENKAVLVTDDIIAGENNALKVIFSICKIETDCPFSNMIARDIEIKDNRNKYENLINSANAYSILRGAGMNDMTALETTRLVSDAITVAKLNEQSKENEAQIELEREIQKTKELKKVSNENDTTDNGSNTDNGV